MPVKIGGFGTQRRAVPFLVSQILMAEEPDPSGIDVRLVSRNRVAVAVDLRGQPIPAALGLMPILSLLQLHHAGGHCVDRRRQRSGLG